MAKDARIIMTYKCNRKCPGCANTYSSVMNKAMPLKSVKQLQGYDTLVISGGEPMLFPDRVIKLAKVLKKAAPQAKIFLYTAYNKNNSDIERVIPHIDGINYTVHDHPKEEDIKGFQAFQDIAAQNKGKSFRLYVDKVTAQSLKINPDSWSRVKMDPWMSEEDMVKAGGCPEDLFVLTRDQRPQTSADIQKPVTEGIIKFSPEQKQEIKDFYHLLKTSIQSGLVNGKLPGQRLMQTLRRFQEHDLSTNPSFRLNVVFYTDYERSGDTGSFIWTGPQQGTILINMPSFMTAEKIIHPDQQAVYGGFALSKFKWPEFLDTLVHEYVHFLQSSSRPERGPVPLTTPRKSYMRNPFEQQAWAHGYLERMKERLGKADPNLILRSLRQHGVVDDSDLHALKSRSPKAWKGVMKQAIMTAMADLEGTGKVPWQTGAKLP